MRQIRVIGGGLAGSEAAWQLAKRGFSVELWEMRPKVSTPAHETGNLGELVTNNNFKRSHFRPLRIFYPKYNQSNTKRYLYILAQQG